MGIFKKVKDGISSRANAALDKATSPEREVEIAIEELEEGRKKALQELISYKATAKQMEADIARYEEKAASWEKRAVAAVKAGDDEAARQALREKKNCLTEKAKIERDRDEAASYAIQLNKSRKEFETKLQILKMKKGTLATQLASARAKGGNAFGHDDEVWDKFARAEARIDEEAIETEVDAALRGETAADQELDAAIHKAALAGGGLAAGQATGALPAGAEDPLEQLKRKMAEEKAKKARALPDGEDKEGGP